MEDHHRPNRLSVPPRVTAPLSFPTATTVTPKPYHLYPSTPTPSKHRLSSLSYNNDRSTNKPSLSFLILLFFSLRSLYSLLPFLRSSPPSFSLFPFSFLVSLLSFLLTLAFSPYTPSSKDPFLLQNQRKHQNQPLLSISLIAPSQRRILFARSVLLAVVFLLRFQSLRYCGAAALILAELSGKVTAGIHKGNIEIRSSKFCGIVSLFVALFLLSISWDRIECFPFSAAQWRLPLLFPKEKCSRVWPMLLPFLSGFVGRRECESMNWGTIRQLGVKRIRLISLFFTTLLLFIPAAITLLVSDNNKNNNNINGIALETLVWPLANTVVFGVLLSENFSDDDYSKDLQKEFLVTFSCTVILELFYFPDLSLWGLLLCGIFLWAAIRQLDDDHDDVSSKHHHPNSLAGLIMIPLRHILSEKKSRKIALFLLINTGYMVVEFVAGFMSNSLGLISDACHMLFDCAALAIGLYASYISRLPANSQYNYGRGRFEVLSGYINAVLLVLVGALIVVESFERILDPREISTGSLLTVSIGGLLVNLVGLVFFHEQHHHAHGGPGSCLHLHDNDHVHEQHHVHGGSGSCSSSHHHALEVHIDEIWDQGHGVSGSHSSQHDHVSNPNDHHGNHHRHIDHNMEGIFLHVLADAMGSLGVVISTLAIKYKGWQVADPACSIFISVLIISSVLPLLRNSAQILLQRVPRSHKWVLEEALSDIVKLKGVCGIRNLRIWSLTNTVTVGTIHVHVFEESDMAPVKAEASRILRNVGMDDLTLQVECVTRGHI